MKAAIELGLTLTGTVVLVIYVYHLARRELLAWEVQDWYDKRYV